MSLKLLIQSGMNRVGLNLTRTPPPHTLAHHVKKFLHTNEITLVLDVGAFRGEYCRMLRDEAGYRGWIASFEPCPDSFRLLNIRMAGDSRWRGFNIGLSDKDRPADLNTYGDRGDFNSLLTLREDAANIYGVNTESVATQAIQLKRIDTIWNNLTDIAQSPRVFLKIDTQGHDIAVVLGATAHLEDIHGIQTEMSAVALYGGMTLLPEALRIFGQRGYIPIGFYPVNTPGALGFSPEFDVLLKRHEGRFQA